MATRIINNKPNTASQISLIVLDSPFGLRPVFGKLGPGVPVAEETAAVADDTGVGVTVVVLAQVGLVMVL